MAFDPNTALAILVTLGFWLCGGTHDKMQLVACHCPVQLNVDHWFIREHKHITFLDHFGEWRILSDVTREVIAMQAHTDHYTSRWSS